MSRRNSASASHSLLHRYPNVHYALNAYNSAVHHYNQEVRAAAGGLSAPAAPPTRHLDKARADFLAAVATLPDAESRKVYMDEYERTHVERYNGPSKRRKKSSSADLYADTDYAAGTSYEDGPESLHLRELLADAKRAVKKSAAKKSAAKKSDLVMTPALARAIATLDEEKSKIRENRRRKNASFTLHQTYGSGHGDRTLTQAFYAMLNKLYPGSTPVPIPPESQVHPKHDVETQTFIFVDFAVRKIAPIALRAARLKVEGAKLEKLKQITNKETADAAANAAAYAYEDVAAFADAGVHNAAYDAAADAVSHAADAVDDAAVAAAHATHYAAKLNPDATWAAVNEMLQAL